MSKSFPLRLLASALVAPTLPAVALDLQGHRGARALAPENTLAGFARALGIGVTTLELDIAIARDGVLLVSHDRALNPDITRGPDGHFLCGRGPVIFEMTAGEVGRYDVGRLEPGNRYAASLPEQRALDGARIPRLTELFDLVKKSGNTEVRFAIETKISPAAPDESPAPEPFTRALVAALREAGMASRSNIISFDWRTLQIVQKEAPEIGTTYLTAQQTWMDNIGADAKQPSAWTASLRYRDHGSVPRLIKAAGGKTWSSLHGDLSAGKVNEAHDLGIRLPALWVLGPQPQSRRMPWPAPRSAAPAHPRC